MNKNKNKNVEKLIILPKLNLYFGTPEKQIKKFGPKVLDTMEKMNNSILNIEFVNKLREILSIEDNQFNLAKFFELSNGIDLSVSYFKHLLVEEIKANALMNNSAKDLKEYLDCAIFSINPLLSSNQWNREGANDFDKKIIYDMCEENMLKMINSDYSNSLIKSYLELDPKPTHLVLFKAISEDNDDLISLIYKHNKKRNEKEVIELLQKENIINALLGKNWSKYIQLNYKNDINSIKLCHNLSKDSIDFENMGLNFQNLNIQKFLEKIFSKESRDFKYLSGLQDENKLAVNLFSIDTIRKIEMLINNNDVLFKYIFNSIKECMNDVKLAAYQIKIEGFDSNKKILIWSNLYSNLLTYKWLVKNYIKIKDESFKNILPDETLKFILDFLKDDDYTKDIVGIGIMKRHQELVSRNLKDILSNIKDNIGPDFLFDIIKNQDISAMPQIDIFKNEFFLQQNISTNNNTVVKKVVKF